MGDVAQPDLEHLPMDASSLDQKSGSFPKPPHLCTLGGEQNRP